jgi:alkanesulfonate monooxygenase SsuD/methylene tetrahydromethanopterin reductase-like flavin-dependent oxidoreductase (luciferase family)
LANWQVGPQEFARKSRTLADLCEAAGRDPATVRRTHAANFQLFDSERELRRWREHQDRGMSANDEAYIRHRGAFYGTASAITETIEDFTSLDSQGFVVSCNASPAVGALTSLAEFSASVSFGSYPSKSTQAAEKSLPGP